MLLLLVRRICWLKNFSSCVWWLRTSAGCSWLSRLSSAKFVKPVGKVNVISVCQSLTTISATDKSDQCE